MRLTKLKNWWHKPGYRLNVGLYALLFMLYDLLAFNSVFWQKIYALSSPLFTLGSFVALWAVGTAACLLLFWRPTTKPLSYLFLLINAGVFYFVHRYRIAIDSEMLQNVMQTDAAEVRDLLTWRWAGYILLLGGVPCLLIKHLQITPISWWRRFLYVILLLAVAPALILPNSREVFPFVRSHKATKYSLIPVNYIGAIVSLSKEYYRAHRQFVHIGQDAVFTPYWRNGKQNLLIFVVGETARAQNFSLNGYARPTNAPLEAYADQLINYTEATACGTSTAVSVPCMFMPQSRNEYANGSAAYSENVLDMLQHNGYRVTWVENNSDCKNLCGRIELRLPCGLHPQEHECLDEVMLPELQQSVNGAPHNAVVVLHSVGSHGPMYYKRYPDTMQPFTPICRTAALNECSNEELFNVYDNTIYYTSHILSEIIKMAQAWRAQYNVVLIYVSDHGESLGENGLYLHSAPYMVAPATQKHVPFLLWAEDETWQALGIDKECMQKTATMPVSHDNVFHTLLGLGGITAAEYNQALDLTAKCRK